MSSGPCKNPSCNSYGKPHPNCKCYAEGGDVCIAEQPHEPDCKYFQNGGGVDDSFPQDLTPDENFPQDLTPDQPSTEPAPDQGAPVEAVDTSTPEDFPQDLIPDSASDAAPAAPNQKREPWNNYGVTTTPEETARNAKIMLALSPVGIAAKGAGCIAGAIQNGALQTGNEVVDWMAGHGDPGDAIGAALLHIPAAALLGCATGAAGSYAANAAKNALNAKADQQIGSKGMSFLTGIYKEMNAAKPEAQEAIDAAFKEVPLNRSAMRAGLEQESPAPILDQKALESGQKFYQGIVSRGMQAAATGVGYLKGGLSGAAESLVGSIVGKKAIDIASPQILKAINPLASKTLGPVILKVLSSGTTRGMANALDHGEILNAGANAASKVIESVAGGGSKAALQGLNMVPSEADRESLDQHIVDGGYQQNVNQSIYQQQAGVPGMAMGGEVKKPTPEIDKEDVAPVTDENPGVAQHYPAQHALMVAAKSRISSYLASKRPQEHAPKLAYDEQPEDEEAKRSYHKALDVANAPLSVFQHIKDGTLEPEHMNHMQAMYPESVNYLKKKLTERIVKSQLDEESPPPYHVRQGLSMFMGTPLSGEMTPQSIQAAQMTFAPKQAPQQPPTGKAKKGTASLGKAADSYMTPDQSREARQNKG